MKEKAFLVEEMQKYKEIIVHHHWRWFIWNPVIYSKIWLRMSLIEEKDIRLSTEKSSNFKLMKFREKSILTKKESNLKTWTRMKLYLNSYKKCRMSTLEMRKRKATKKLEKRCRGSIIILRHRKKRFWVNILERNRNIERGQIVQNKRALTLL
jgi:hypothetical protein